MDKKTESRAPQVEKEDGDSDLEEITEAAYKGSLSQAHHRLSTVFVFTLFKSLQIYLHHRRAARTGREKERRAKTRTENTASIHARSRKMTFP